MVKRLAGFNLHETTIIPSDHPEKLVGFAAHASAVAVAMRYLQPVAEYQQAGAVTDPRTGMTFGCLRFTDTKEANAPTVFVGLEGPPLIELDGTTACRSNLVAGEYS